VQEVFASIAGAAMSIEGLTISGGEPFQQPEPLAELLEQVRRKTNLSVVLFSGYTWEELSLLQHATRILTNIDVLIAGRYIESRRVASGLIGSANKKIHFLTNRYTLSDFDVIPCAEIIITPDGNVLLTGIDPPGGAGVSPAPKKDRHPH
jgi:anaerobic ribonucleoside-triphosphate reductase activating protein